MKATGIVRKVDNLGRVVLPKELRKTLALKEGDPLEIFTDGEAIILKSYKPGCIFCGEADGGAWRNEAIKNIKEYLAKELEEFKNVKIIA